LEKTIWRLAEALEARVWEKREKLSLCINHFSQVFSTPVSERIFGNFTCPIIYNIPIARIPHFAVSKPFLRKLFLRTFEIEQK
jgi:hypothetical protein